MKPIYHIVSHSHWDREWYKPFEEFRAMLVQMVDDVLDLLNRDSSFRSFTLDGQTVVVEDYLEIKPERAEEIRRLVTEGRLFIGPWYVLPDEFLVSGEAIVRNLLRGIEVARTFGGEMKVGYLPDSFGHIAMMPAILKGFNIDAALLYRGFGGEPDQQTSEYWWKSPDGTRCLMEHLYSNGYSAGYFHQETDAQAIERFGAIKKELDARAATSHRLLMNGGDHHWPDPKLPQTLELLRKNFDGEFAHSNIPDFFSTVKKEMGRIPGTGRIGEISGELRFGYRYAFVVLSGVYSSRMYLKQENWKCENLLQRYVEPLNVFALCEGGISQNALIREAWKNLLHNHPHDSICGCSVDPVHSEMMTRFAAAEQIGRSAIERCGEQLIPSDDRAFKDDRCIFFFNPSPFNRSDCAQAEIKFYVQDVVVGLNPDVKVAPKLPPVRGFTLLNEQGKEIPYQILHHEEGYDITYSRYNYPKQIRAEKFTLLVDAQDVPAIGFGGYTIEKTKKFPRWKTKIKCGRNFIENEHLRVEVSRGGEIALHDKETGEIFSKLHVFEDSGDVGDEYNYSYPAKDRWIYSGKAKANIEAVERGPLRAALRVTVTMNVPVSAAANRRSRGTALTKISISTAVRLSHHSRSVEFETTVNNTAKDHRLRVLFPSGIETNTVYADSQFSVVERKQQQYDVSQFTIEHPAKVAPMQRFVTVKGKTRALTIISYGLPEYELKSDGKGTIALTLLRCVGLLAGEDLITRPGGKGGWHNETPDAQCLGTHTFRYAILPHSPEETKMFGEINREAERLHLPFFSFRRKNSCNTFPKAGLLSVSPPQLVLSAVKESDDGSSLIVRLYNPFAERAEGTIQFGVPVKSVFRSQLNEETKEELAVNERRRVQVSVVPYDILTLKVVPDHEKKISG